MRAVCPCFVKNSTLQTPKTAAITFIFVNYLLFLFSKTELLYFAKRFILLYDVHFLFAFTLSNFTHLKWTVLDRTDLSNRKKSRKTGKKKIMLFQYYTCILNTATLDSYNTFPMLIKLFYLHIFNIN